MSHSIRASGEGVSIVHGRTANVAGSGWSTMSSSSSRMNPSHRAAVEGRPSRFERVPSSWWTGIVTKFFLDARRCRRTARRTQMRTPRSFLAELGDVAARAAFVNGREHRERLPHAGGELIVRAIEVEPADLADLPQAIEHRMAVHV